MIIKKLKADILEPENNLLAAVPYEDAIRSRSNKKQLNKSNELALIDYQTLCIIAENLLSHAPGLVDWKNKDGEFLGCNYNVAKVSGIATPREIIGKIDEDFPWGSNGYGAIIRKFDQKAIEGCIIFDICNIRHTDKDRLLCAKKIPLLDKRKRIVGVLDYLTEIDDSSLMTILSGLAALGIEITSPVIEIAKKYARKDKQYLLSERQKECLYYLIRGETLKEIAKKLDISQRTVETYLTTIKEKFQCPYKSLLIKKVIEMGYKDVIPERLIISHFIKEKISV